MKTGTLGIRHGPNPDPDYSMSERCRIDLAGEQMVKL